MPTRRPPSRRSRRWGPATSSPTRSTRSTRPPLTRGGPRAGAAAALASSEEPRAKAVVDRLLAVATVDTLLGEVVLPYLHELGARWERGEASIAQEHFASGVLRGRLLGLAR